ncbi:MAG: chemotaxis protein CheW [Thermotoga sp.]|mgnify:CR=1 FL=1|nr:MAG: chemotaxis protein CheW [Thermotoga sp.]
MEDVNLLVKDVDNRSIMQLITFELEEGLYAFDVLPVETIIEMVDIRPVPKVASYIKGVINYRGRIIPVMALSERIDLKRGKIEKYNRIIITHFEDIEVGFLVSNVREVINVTDDQIEKVNSLQGNEVDTRFIKGVIKSNDQLIIFLDIKAILDTEIS